MKEATAAARADWLTGLEEAMKEATADARANWLTGLEEAMKEAMAADGVGDSRRVHQIMPIS